MSKFDLGQIVITSNAKSQLLEIDIIKALNRHSIGDWGTLCDEDWKSNEDALKFGDRLFSVYKTSDTHEDFWVITEWNRSSTTILMPEDY